MKNSLKMKNKHFIMILISVLTSYSYGEYGEVDLESKLWELAKSKSDHFCNPVNFIDVNVNIFNEDGQSPLMVAAQHNNSKFIMCMTQAKVDVLMKDHNGKTAFDYIKKPENEKRNMFTTSPFDALNVLHVAQFSSRLAREHINCRKDTFEISIKDNTTLIKNSMGREFTKIEDIPCIAIEKKKRDGPAYAIYENDVNRDVPPIFAAIQNRMYNKLRQILDMGADIEMINKFGDTPLIFAIYQKDDKLVEILLEYGANPNVKDGPLYTALSETVVRNQISTVKLLLKYGADVNYQYDKRETALTVAAKSCKNFKMVKLLLDYGADPELIDRYRKNTLTGLKGYCNDDKLYKRMRYLIEGSM